MKKDFNICNKEKHIKPIQNKVIFICEYIKSNTIDKIAKSSILNEIFKMFTNSVKTLKKTLFLNQLFLKGKAMNTKTKFTTALASLALLALLAACGGGGDSQTPPVTYTAAKTCWDSTRPTSSASQVDADSKVPTQCPPLPESAYAATTVAVGANTLTMSISGLPAGFAGGTLTATGQASGGTWDITVSASGVITLTPRGGASLDWATSYSGTIAMNFVGAPSVSKNITFTTAPLTCTAPKVPDASGNNCVDPVPTFAWPTSIKTSVGPVIVDGVVVNPSAVIRTWLPTNPLTDKVRDVNWDINLALGNIVTINTNEVAPDANGTLRNLGHYVYQNYSGGYCLKPFYADTGEAYSTHQGATGFGCYTGSAPQWVIGYNDSTDPAKGGVMYKGSTGFCAKFISTTGESKIISCPF